MNNNVLILLHNAKRHYGFLRIWRLRNECATQLQYQAGFTLLELLVVIGLLAIVTVGSMTLLIDDGNWKRAIETEQRWDNLRKAIVGESNQTLNGAPYMSGYVADMGRLPVSVVELIDRNVTYDDDNNPATPEINRPFDHDKSAGTADIEIEQPSYSEIVLYKKTPTTNCINAPEDCYTLGGGWRGPYLYTAGSREYRDAWDNADVDNDLFNFGWSITLTGTYPNVSDIAIQSFGSDNQAGGVETSADFPGDATQNMVNANEWTLSTAPITFNINFSKPVSSTTLPPVGIDSLPQELELRIYRYVDNGDADADFVDDINVESADATFTLVEDNTVNVQTITPTTNLPVGRFAAVLWCVTNTPPSGSAPAGADAVYDGNCDDTFSHNPVYFTLTPYTTDVTLRWNLP